MFQSPLIVRFWGVRGSIPSPGPHTVRYGGNTPCVEMQAGGERLIFDGGTGLRVLGEELLKHLPVTAHLFFSHTHWDHIQGFPFFQPAFIPGNSFCIYGVPGLDGHSIQQCLHDQMLHPNFPVPLQIMAGSLQFRDLEPGEILEIGDVRVINQRLNHPGGGVGYRLQWQDQVVSYVTDTEHYPDQLDPAALKLAHQANVMIYDATYTDGEYYSSAQSKVGWGHSTWQEAVKLAQAAEVEKLILFHHDPTHDDDFLDEVQALAQQVFPNTVVAVEGMVLSLSPRTTAIPCVHS